MKIFLIIVGVVVAVFVAMLVYGSQHPETGDDKIAKIAAACADQPDPTACKLRETILWEQKVTEDNQREVDRRAGN